MGCNPITPSDIKVGFFNGRNCTVPQDSRIPSGVCNGSLVPKVVDKMNGKGAVRVFAGGQYSMALSEVLQIKLMYINPQNLAHLDSLYLQRGRATF